MAEGQEWQEPARRGLLAIGVKLGELREALEDSRSVHVHVQGCSRQLFLLYEAHRAVKLPTELQHGIALQLGLRCEELSPSSWRKKKKPDGTLWNEGPEGTPRGMQSIVAQKAFLSLCRTAILEVARDIVAVNTRLSHAIQLSQAFETSSGLSKIAVHM